MSLPVNSHLPLVGSFVQLTLSKTPLLTPLPIPIASAGGGGARNAEDTAHKRLVASYTLMPLSKAFWIGKINTLWNGLVGPTGDVASASTVSSESIPLVALRCPAMSFKARPVWDISRMSISAASTSNESTGEDGKVCRLCLTIHHSTSKDASQISTIRLSLAVHAKLFACAESASSKCAKTRSSVPLPI